MKKIFLILIALTSIGFCQVDSLRSIVQAPSGSDVDSLHGYIGTANPPTTLQWRVNSSPNEIDTIYYQPASADTYYVGWKAVDDTGNVSEFSSILSVVISETAGIEYTIDTLYSSSGTGNAAGQDIATGQTGVDYTISQIHDDEGRGRERVNAFEYIGLTGSATTDQFQASNNFCITFNASTISGVTIDTVQLCLYMYDNVVDMGEFDFSVVDMNPDPSNFTSMVATEGNNYGTTKFATKNSANLNQTSTETLEVFTFNASGISNFNQGGYVAYIVELDDVLDEALNDLTWGSGSVSQVLVRTSDDATYKPFLRVVYH